MLYTFISLLIIAIISGGYISSEIGNKPTTKELASFEKLSYFKNGQFQNPKQIKSIVRKIDGDYEDKMNLLKFIFTTPHAPKKALPITKLAKDSFSLNPNENAIYWLGHSSAILELEGKRFGIDLVLENASPIPFTARRYQESPIQSKDLPKFHYIILTHNHYDHLERSTIKAIKNAHFIVPLGVGATLKGWGITSENITELGWNESYEHKDIKITAVEGVHFSGHSFTDKNQSLWNSYIIKTKNQNIFWGGDSGYNKHYAEIGKKYGPFEWAALEIDAWSQGWPDIHLFPKQTVQAAIDLKAQHLLPIHWGVFDLGWHPWDKSINRVDNAAAEKNIPLITPKMGEKFIIGKTKSTKWWRN